MNIKQREIIAYWYNQLSTESGQVEEAFQFMKDMIKELRGSDKGLDALLKQIDDRLKY
ncbi:hypothetical protein [Bacteroides sp. 51]|uniref:hypothetical protein n=1 Tax=Bacteroides sp. 51 TaxID=2302938 RepID=UPI0013D348F3|nr:hypothetical protein [Bacteroides sp. 51]